MIPIDASESILVVDDEPSIRSMLQTGIQMAGHHCLTAGTPSQALDILTEHHIDVVVTDIRMPEMNGIELAGIIKQRSEADVIVMTGFVRDFNYEDMIDRGASDFIQKPVRIAEFVARLKRVLTERATRRERQQALEQQALNLDKLRRAMDGIVQAISLSVEMRDPYTAGHQQRVATLATAIARELEMGEDDIDGLRMASVIHDLGKITIPAEILSKPGQLSDLEYALIKNHVQAGYDILKKIEFPWPLADIVHQHHERMDGSGYPLGLSGDDILYPARILAVADVYETISSHRPYRPSLGNRRALDEIETHAGQLYDARAARACVRLIQEKGFVFTDPQA